MSHTEYNPALHRLALLTAAATFPLIFMGGLVTSHHAGMSVPDWPNSYGYNMFLFPPRLWVGNILYEHTHRLMGSVVGMLAIALALVAWRTEPRRWVVRLAAATLLAVILQGVLGGLRVVLVKLDLAIVHACVAQAFFCLAALVAIVSSRWWIEAEDLNPQEHSPRRLFVLAVACVIAIYAQLIVGATMRHYDAGLAIPDLPFAYGRILPPMDDASLGAINHTRVWEMNLPEVKFHQIWLHFGHRIGALVVAAVVITLVVSTFRRTTERRLRFLALLLIVELLSQLTLGVLTVLLKKPADIASFHVAVGALTLVTCWTLTVCIARVYVSVFRTERALEHDTEVNIPAGVITA